MMRKILLASVALCAASAAASAADLPTRMPAPAPIAYAAPVFTWTGFYAGVNAGAVWTGKDACPIAGTSDNGGFTATTGYAPNCGRDGNTTFLGGGQAGFNYQMGALVLGLEGDIDWMGRSGARGYDYAQSTPQVTNVYGAPPADSGDGQSLISTTSSSTVTSYRAGHGSNMLSTIRGRLGFALDRSLFYVTGGVAFRNGGNGGSITQTTNAYTSNTVIDNGPLTPGISSGPTDSTVTTTTTYARSGSSHNVGWVLGGGVEYALSQNVSAKLEYIHAQFEKDNGFYTANGSTTVFSGKSDNSVDAVRVGLNFRFGAPAAPAAVSPVSARY